jgi:hypothetical protein
MGGGGKPDNLCIVSAVSSRLQSRILRKNNLLSSAVLPVSGIPPMPVNITAALILHHVVSLAKGVLNPFPYIDGFQTPFFLSHHSPDTVLLRINADSRHCFPEVFHVRFSEENCSHQDGQMNPPLVF